MRQIPLLAAVILWGCIAHAQPKAIIRLDAIVNTYDGSSRRECLLELALGMEKPIYAYVALFPKWSNIRCGDGKFKDAQKRHGRIFANPYVYAEIEVTPDLTATQTITRPRKKPETKVNQLGDSDDELIVPFFVATPEEVEKLDIYEAFVRLRPWIIGHKKVAYGKISLKTDIPGLDIYVDGGHIGRSLEREPALLENMVVGAREVEVRDLSGRSAKQRVTVEEAKVSTVSLDLLQLSKKRAQGGLIPLGKNQQGFEEFWRKKDGAVVIRIPAGKFLMGSKEGEGEENERPQRTVTLDEYLIDKNEVTWRQFKKYVDETKSKLPPEPLWGRIDDYAASNIVWKEASAYCDWVGGKLPSEAEWEKAARGTDGRKYPWGNEWEIDRCNGIEGGPHRPKSVTAFPNCVSPFGVINMAGNAWEWSADPYQEDPENPDNSKYLKASASEKYFLLKGGGWMNMAPFLRPAVRYKSSSEWRNPLYGFRCVQKVNHARSNP